MNIMDIVETGIIDELMCFDVHEASNAHGNYTHRVTCNGYVVWLYIRVNTFRPSQIHIKLGMLYKHREWYAQTTIALDNLGNPQIFNQTIKYLLSKLPPTMDEVGTQLLQNERKINGIPSMEGQL